MAPGGALAQQIPALREEDLAAAEVVSRRSLLRRQLALRTLSVLLLLLLWELLSRIVQFHAIASPAKTLSSIGEEFHAGTLMINLGFTLRRVAEGFALSMVIGVAAGVAIGAYKTLDALFSLWVTVLITVPGLIYLVIGYIAFGIRADTGAIFAVTAMVAPTVLVSIVQGTRALDHRLIDMARSYRHNTPSIFWRVVLPQLAPYIFGAARYSLPLTWQMVIFAEVVGRPNGFGFEIYYNYQTSNIAGVWAYSFAFVAVALFLELGVLAPMQRRLFRWRQDAKL
jgi:NitT/TauT family transport system permease protein